MQPELVVTLMVHGMLTFCHTVWAFPAICHVPSSYEFTQDALLLLQYTAAARANFTLIEDGIAGTATHSHGCPPLVLPYG